MNKINQSSTHFTIISLSEDLYAIQEDISEVNPIYTNDPLNLYLLLGNKSALLIDTGCGLAPLRPIVKDLIKERDLIVVNSHAHWDHILGNEEFEKIYIHENEAPIVSKQYDLSHQKDLFKCYSNRNFIIPPCKNIKIIKDGDEFDLGDRNIEVIHAPGHSPGSICLFTSENDLFTGDVAYYGDQFLPSKKKIPDVLETLSNLIILCNNKSINKLYPSHQQTPCDISLLYELHDGISRIQRVWNKRKWSSEFYSWVIEDPDNKKLRYIIAPS
jgi:glyoxylase-like metal-dependent hydrolase (beta-lactamase superfamily II)